MIPHLLVTPITIQIRKKKLDKISPFVDLGIYWYGYDNAYIF